MAEWIEVPNHRIYVISTLELQEGFDYIGRMGDPRGAAKFRIVSCERRMAKFLSGLASPCNVAEFMTTRRSKRYDSKKLGVNAYGANHSRRLFAEDF